MNAKRVLVVACAAALATMAAGQSAAQELAGSSRLHPASAEQARASSIQMLAKSFGVTSEAAASRLNVEEHASDIVARIRDQYADRLAGIYIEHEPTHRLVVRLTGNEAVPADTYQFGDDHFVVDYQVGAEHTLADLQARFDSGFGGLKARFPDLQSGFVDERTGQIVLEVVNERAGPVGGRAAMANDRNANRATARQQQLFDEYFGAGTRIASIGHISNQAIKGSGNLDATSVQCTGSFTVKSVSTPVTYGLLTAGHCQATTLSYTEVGTTTPITSLNWVAAKNDSSSDLGWASVSTNAADAIKSFYNGSIFVTPLSPLTKASTVVGQSMCHYGRSTISSGSVCGTVQSTAYNPGSICGTSGTGACSATFVAVDVSTSTPCQPSDSGGNWYFNRQPSGVHKAADPSISGRCVYTSTDDISSPSLNLQFL